MMPAMTLQDLALLGLAPPIGVLSRWGAGRLVAILPCGIDGIGGDVPQPPSLTLALPLAVGVAVWSVCALPEERAAAGCLLGWTLVVLAMVDGCRFILPDALTLPLLGAGLLIAAGAEPDRLSAGAAGAAAGYAALRLLGEGYRRLRGREGLGQGDAKLLAAAGAWVGWEGLGSVVLIASALGLLWVLAARNGDLAAADRPLPFGPFLCLGIWSVWTMGTLHGA